MPFRPKFCPFGRFGALLVYFSASAAFSQEALPTFRTAPSRSPQSQPPPLPLPNPVQPFGQSPPPDQFQVPGQFPAPGQAQLPNPSPPSSQIPPASQPLMPSPLPIPGLLPLPGQPTLPWQLPLPSQLPVSGQSPDQMPLSGQSLDQVPLSVPLSGQSQDQNIVAPSNITGRNAAQRIVQAPIGFELHPLRNLAPIGGDVPFTFRTSNADAVQAQVALALQMEIRHDDNINDAPSGSAALRDTIVEYTPSLQINVGSIPGPRDQSSLDSEYYLQIQYLPTIHELLAAGTSTTLQHVIGEIGRANVISTTSLHAEYDQNLFGVSGNTNPEEAYSVFELSPLIKYNLSEKTAIRAQAFYRRIILQQASSDRTEYVIDTGIDCQTSDKTIVGMGGEFGHITFDQREFDVQDYQQGYLSFAWKPGPTITFQNRLGVELREFLGSISQPERISPVAISVLNWRPSDRTNVNAGIRVRNIPSVIDNGALYQEVRFSVDATHYLGTNFYVRGEVDIIHDNYDTGLTNLEYLFRPAFGYHTEGGHAIDSLNFEVFYQLQETHSNQSTSNYDRTLFGVQSTVHF